MATLQDMLQAASNAAASNISGPVDGLAWLLRKAGVPIPAAPVMGSDWLRERGLLRDVKPGAAQVAGETLGLLAPIVAAAKAPQIARGLLSAAENAAAPRTLNPQAGAVVWHGSPHKFDKFDASKIGTGEGAQAYGHGLYLADTPEVAKSYKLANKDKLDLLNSAEYKAALEIERQMNPPAKTNFFNTAPMTQNDAIDKLIQTAKRNVALSVGRDDLIEANMRAMSAYENLRGKDLAETLGHFYKVDLPDEKIARMLDWDKPLSQQAPEVQKAIEALKPNMAPVWQKAITPMTSGQSLNIAIGSGTNRTADAAELLRQQGIPGIRYLDGGSRGAGAGTSNFVVFPGEESILKILERNGVPMGGL